MGFIGNFFNKVKTHSQTAVELVELQKTIKKKFKDFQKEIDAEGKDEIEITPENEEKILNAMSKFLKECIAEVDKMKSLNFQQKIAAKEQIVKQLTKELKKNIDYFKNMKPKEIRKKLGL